MEVEIAHGVEIVDHSSQSKAANTPVKLSYKESLAGIDTTPEGMKADSNAYPESDDDVYDAEEDNDDCPLICMKKKRRRDI